MEIIYFHGPVFQDIFYQYTDIVRFVNGAESDLLTKDVLSQMRNKMFLIDDCYFEINKRDKDLIHFLFCTITHHSNSSCYLLLHNLYSQSIASLRETVLNANFFAFTSSPTNKSMLRTWALQFYPKRWKSVLSILDHIFSQSRFAYATFDFSPWKDDRYRVSTYLTPEEGDRCLYLFTD